VVIRCAIRENLRRREVRKRVNPKRMRRKSQKRMRKKKKIMSMKRKAQ
jgi:hypothetical protein